MEDKIQSTSKKLRNISHLLQLAHHRNKNQHRVARWYKFFGQLRRHIGKLIRELEMFATAMKLSGISSPGLCMGFVITSNKYLARAYEAIEQRSGFMRCYLIPKCHLAFENLIADNQYAALGLMLMGLLASVSDNLSMLPCAKEEDDNSFTVDLQQNDSKSSVITDTQVGHLGEIVSREEFEARVPHCVNQEKIIGKKPMVDKASDEQRLRNHAKESQTEEQKLRPKTKIRKKNTKKGDVFDDIFKKLL